MRWLARALCALAIGGIAAGCASDATGDGGKFSHVAARGTTLYWPKGVPASRKVPVFVLLHSYGTIGPYMEPNVHFQPIADKYGFAIAYPTSVTLFKGGQTWENASWMPKDDIDHLRDEIRKLARNSRIDPSRIFVVGTSIGGSMTYRVGCELSSEIAGFGAVSGAMFMKKGTCEPARPLSVLTIVGDKDGSLPLAGRPGIASPLATTKRWARIDHCPGGPVRTTAGNVATQTWSGCNQRSKVALSVVAGGAHGWPGVRPYDSGEAFWQYFKSVRRTSSRP